MSGHNKWSKIKHKKALGDKKKSKTFSDLARQITIESKKCEGNKESSSLRGIIQKARSANMPSLNIDKAISRGVGSLLGDLSEVTYETYGPGGVALIIEGITDNKNRTSQEIKHILSKHGTSLASQGAASWAFVKEKEQIKPTNLIPLSEKDKNLLDVLISDILENEDVESVITNCEI